MSGMLGMDTGAVRTLAGHLGTKAEEIDSLTAALTSELDGVQWMGTDGDTFRNDWHTTYRNQLSTISSALRDASSRAVSNAVQQEEASAR